MGNSKKSKIKVEVPRDLTAEEVVHWLKAQDNMPHPLRTNARIIMDWMKAMNTGLPEHLLKKLRPEVIALWYRYGSAFAWTREQVEACLRIRGADLRSPVSTTPWQRQQSLPALADAFPRADSGTCARAIEDKMAVEAAASERQAGPEITRPPPGFGQTGAAPAAAEEWGKKREKEGAKKDGGLAQNAPAGVGHLPPATPLPRPELPGFVFRSTPRLGLEQRQAMEPSAPPYVPPPSGSVYVRPGASTRPGDSALAPANQQPSSLLDRSTT